MESPGATDSGLSRLDVWGTLDGGCALGR
jgi:hypothetical protein